MSTLNPADRNRNPLMLRPTDRCRRTTAVGLAALTLAAGLTGCGGPGETEQPAPAEDTAVATAADTLRGTIAVVGADPMTRVILRTDDQRVTLRGSATDRLRRVTGLVVRVTGRRDGAAMTVTSFRVREAEGLPAADGILEVDGDTAVLVTPDGERLRYSPVPTALRARAGARVWIAGPVGGEPQAWGVIGERTVTPEHGGIYPRLRFAPGWAGH